MSRDRAQSDCIVYDSGLTEKGHVGTWATPPLNVSFRRIWRAKPRAAVRDIFAKSENWPWRGPFWLSKDTFENDMRDSTEPDGRRVADLRNHLEHKYVKVVEWSLQGLAPGPFHDTLAHTITRDELERRTLRLMQLSVPR
jgi:hypothetical protein